MTQATNLEHGLQGPGTTCQSFARPEPNQTCLWERWLDRPELAGRCNSVENHNHHHDDQADNLVPGKKEAQWDMARARAETSKQDTHKQTNPATPWWATHKILRTVNIKHAASPGLASRDWDGRRCSCHPRRLSSTSAWCWIRTRRLGLTMHGSSWPSSGIPSVASPARSPGSSLPAQYQAIGLTVGAVHLVSAAPRDEVRCIYCLAGDVL